ncbi:MAG: response regulator, partial [Sulfitobacter sp.]
GGQIGFESTPGGVTVFWFTVPLSEQASVPGAAGNSETARDDRPKLAILHVEDDHDFAEVLAGALGEFANVKHAKSLLMARKIIAGDPLDVIILDWTLPDGDASSIMNQIKLLQPAAHIIGLSAQSKKSPDPRLSASMIKSRSDIGAIVASVNKCVDLAS